ncbi:MAG: FAD-dependent oxidoreductase, partial [Coriobacteriia bacterium]|nr:FAD-dependent oxidoreductase [Coriobacteriia bacterium]
LHAGRVLTGRQVPGKKVLVVGGGLVGTETADFLGELGYDVTLLATRSYYGVGMIGEHKKFVDKNFAQNHVKVIYNGRACEFLPDGVDYTDATDGSIHAIRGFDSVVMALGYQSVDKLSEPLSEAGFNVHTIGDAVKARRCLNATEEARAVAMAL